MQSLESKNNSISVNVAVLTVSDTRTMSNDKSGDYLVSSVKKEGHNCSERNIVTDDVDIILNVLRKLFCVLFIYPRKHRNPKTVKL